MRFRGVGHFDQVGKETGACEGKRLKLSNAGKTRESDQWAGSGLRLSSEEASLQAASDLRFHGDISF